MLRFLFFLLIPLGIYAQRVRVGEHQHGDNVEAHDGGVTHDGHSHLEHILEYRKETAYVPNLPPPILFKGIGEVDFKISTKSAKTQQYFNQGIALLHCFWDFEAYRAFKEAIKNDRGEDKEERLYHVMNNGQPGGYRGNEIIAKSLIELGLLTNEQIPKDYSDQNSLYKEKGCFIGSYTLEVDMMDELDTNGIETLKNVYEELKPGGEEMQQNFENALDNKKYWSALNEIEGNISKGRFAQRLANELTKEMLPDYILDGIEVIVNKVKESHE